MVIGFNKQFIKPIKSGIKKHTIRIDKHNRWKPGMTMHMATGVRTKKYKQFSKKKCTGVQQIRIVHFNGDRWEKPFVNISVDNKLLSQIQIEILAKNDGFKDVESFFKWFNKDFTGKLIHWTNLK